ncbi:MAG: MFS transporter [Candidatus Rokuibacteriota bacterium]|nr:MAG: MFS transporter [Candidatus Rokubacteria bacterium]PYO11624.1 MAG: MFS transporter [Candidatus Rokubacteria bacterium]
MHFVHDGFSDILYVLLPIWANEFRLTFAQVGIIRTAYSGGMAAFQIPAGLLAERWGERRLLAAGTAVTACGFIAAGAVGGFLSLLLVLLIAGLGSGVQHPLSSSLVSKAYETGPRRAALGTYNFSGDLGKVAVPAAVALAAVAVGWRTASVAYGVIGLVAAATILGVLSRLTRGMSEAVDRARSQEPVAASSGWGIRDPRGFQALTAIGMIDNATRTGFLTFLPFALIAKGSSVAGVGTALALLFAGGAVGKFACGLVAERLGVIRTVVLTEAATALGILALIPSPLPVALAILPLMGVALNGTSSVLYGTVADLVTAERRSRAYGLYYTVTIMSSALAPSVYGLIGDVAGVPATLVVVSALVLTTIPLCLVLRASVAEPARA